MPTARVIGIGVAVVAVAAAGIAIALTGGPAKHHGAAASSGQQATGPIRLESISPTEGATGVNGAEPIIVTFSAPLAAHSPVPTLTPNIAGRWTAEGDSLVFQPASAINPLSRVTVQVPGGAAGIRSATGQLLTTSATEHFTTGPYSEVRLAELFVQLGYLPMTWTPATNGATRAENALLGASVQNQAAQAYDPPAGTFQWQSGYPSSLTSQWSPDQPNVVLRGAIMAFQSQHGLAVNGAVTPRLWRAVFNAAARGEQNSNGYSYAVANKGSPETLTIWHDGHIVFHSLTNTGIPVSPTVDGTFPVYLRLRSQIMSGTNPDGSHYADPVAFVAYFNGGDAIHYFPRGSYGFQQSLGCVELPWGAAQQAYPFTTYGTLVTVSG